MIAAAMIVICYACKKSGIEQSSPNAVKDTVADITSFKLESVDPEITLTSYSVNIKFADTITSANNLVAQFTLSPGCEAHINGIIQVSGSTKNNFENALYYEVTNSSGFTKRWLITTTNNDYCHAWALGDFLKQSLSNDRSYTWYFNQSSTGAYSSVNCGPTCATMAIKWADSLFTGLPQNARDYFPNNTGLWGLHTIADYLEVYGVRSKNITLGSTETETKNIIKEQLDQHNILVLQLNTGSIRTYSGPGKDPRCDKYYPETFNHFIITYGYKEVGDEFYFQVMDPWGSNYVNMDGTCKGTNRYYRYEDIFKACNAGDNIELIVYKNN